MTSRDVAMPRLYIDSIVIFGLVSGIGIRLVQTQRLWFYCKTVSNFIIWNYKDAHRNLTPPKKTKQR